MVLGRERCEGCVGCGVVLASGVMVLDAARDRELRVWGGVGGVVRGRDCGMDEGMGAVVRRGRVGGREGVGMGVGLGVRWR